MKEKIKELRKELGLTQEELAHKLGVSFATINRWENGKQKPGKLAIRAFERLASEMVGSRKPQSPVDRIINFFKKG